MKKILYIALVALCAACTPADVDPSKLFMTESQVQEMIDKNGGKCMTIEEFTEWLENVEISDIAGETNK